MKKFFISFLLILTSFLIPVSAGAEFDLSSAWQQWVQMRRIFFRTTPSSSSIKQTITLPSTIQKTKTKIAPTYRKPKRTIIARSSIRARVTALRPRTSIHTITHDPIQVFTIGVRNTTVKSSTRFVESVLLDRATFRLFSNSGIAEDVRNLEIDINGETASFDSDGSVTLQFHNARIPRGESVDFDVSVRIKDPAATPHVPGTLRLRLEKMTAYGESSQKSMSVQVTGTSTSSKIAFKPVSTFTGGNSLLSANTYTTVSGGTLAAGEQEMVLSVNLSARYDDLRVREVILRNTLTGSDIDPFISRVRAINLQTGNVLATGRFSNGAAKLKMSPRVFVGRNQQVRIGFEVTVKDPIPHSSLDARFELDIAPADLLVESSTTGNSLSDSNKNFSIDSRQFAMTQGRMTVVSSGGQHPFVVGTSSPETVFRFMVNGGASHASLGRLSLQVFPNGLEFSGGNLDAGDIQLVRVNGGREYVESVNITASGNTITLDFPAEFSLIKNSTTEFGLRVALDDISGNNDSDLVSVRLLGDTDHNIGTLASVRSSGASFIWSDTSARLHSVSTADWFSGRFVSGLPSNNTVVWRFGN